MRNVNVENGKREKNGFVPIIFKAERVRVMELGVFSFSQESIPSSRSQNPRVLRSLHF